ncbi:hypothetical protein PS3A_01890 [Pseudomonas sp. 3A(2025)]
MNAKKGAPASTGSACLKKAIDSLPELSPRPDYAIDHTGKRRGKMTAIAWYRSSNMGKGALWLCRCECGLFEYRRPGNWQSRPHPDDMCNACLRAKGPNSKVTAHVRYQQWIEGLRDLGLTENEVTQIIASGSAIETRDKTAAEVREQIAREGL